MSDAILENTVLLNLTISSPGNTRKVDTSHVEVDADRDMLKLSKELWKSSEYDAIKSLMGEARRWVQAKCLPASFTKGGFHILPLPLMEQVVEKLKELHRYTGPPGPIACVRSHARPFRCPTHRATPDHRW
jgi:hypothetical protein